ncbi:MAG: 30S ribosomal protein S16 [Patescibacteria group bacterium]
MLKIRFQKIGKRHESNFRLILTDSRKPAKTGRFLEILGSYSPAKDTHNFKSERIKYWISKGAKVSDTAHNLLLKEKIIEGKKVDILHHNKINKKKKTDLQK